MPSSGPVNFQSSVMMEKAKGVALVTGAEMSGYGIMRSLGRAGISVVALTDGVEDFGRYSKYCRLGGSYTDGQDGEQICGQLEEWSTRLQTKPVLFVTSDWMALLAAEHQERLAPHFAFHWAPADVLATITNKARISLFCGQHGIRVPRSHFTEPGEDVGGNAASFPFPCLVKVTRHFERGSFPDADLTVFQSPAALEEYYRTRPGLLGHTFWQQIIEGGDDNVFECNVLIRRSGDVGGVCCVRRLRQYPPQYGFMSYGRTEENQAVIEESLKLLRALDYRGLANIEFKYQPKDSNYYFIEMNPRLPWSTTLFAAAGVNLPYRAFLDLTGAPDGGAFRNRQRDGIYTLSFNHDAGWYARTRQEHGASLLSWLWSLRKARAHAWWDWRDPRPGIAAAQHLLRVAWLKCRRAFT